MTTTLPPWMTAQADQLTAAVDANIDRLGAAMRNTRAEGHDENDVLRESAELLDEDPTLTRSNLALYYARTADRLARALAELESSR
jgi:hypothetical protein